MLFEKILRHLRIGRADAILRGEMLKIHRHITKVFCNSVYLLGRVTSVRQKPYNAGCGNFLAQEQKLFCKLAVALIVGSC